MVGIKNLVELMHKLVVLEKLSASFLPSIVIKKVSYLTDRWWVVCARIQALFTFGYWNNVDIKPCRLLIPYSVRMSQCLLSFLPR